MAAANELDATEKGIDTPDDNSDGQSLPIVINASGHKQELQRNFSLLSVASVGLVTGAAWPTLGGSILVALFNGGAPGVLYEFLTASFVYAFVFAAIAELASAIPSAAGVYHWASVGGGPRFGKACGFFAGWWNFLAWSMATATLASIAGNIIVSMWSINHADYVFQRWHVFVVYLIITWLSYSLVAFGNRFLPNISTLGLVLMLGSLIATVLVCTIRPSTTGNGYASSASVWSDWQNLTGYSSNGFAFLTGMLNGAFAIGTPDLTTHLSEELPNPRINIPKAMLAQFVISVIGAIGYAIAILYAVTDISAVLDAKVPFPLAIIYLQGASSSAGATALLFLILLCIVFTDIGSCITAGRILFTLARDNATPFPRFLSRVSPWGNNPMNATLVCGLWATILGCIYLGSVTAFNALIDSFVLLSSLSYLMAILPHLLTRRRYIAPGPFALGGIWAFVVPAIASVFIVFFFVIYCFPFGLPVTAQNMNYTSVILAGLSLLIGLWYLWKRSRGYEGPLIMHEETRRRVAAAEMDI